MIPEWNNEGLIPPIDAANPLSTYRSPYETNLISIVDRFASSNERCEILQGFLDHRAALHQMGLVEGFQWLDGSFMEHVELIDGRPPADVDVVTFLPIDDECFEGLTSAQQRLLIDNAWIKEHYKVDFYAQSLRDDPSFLVSMSAYWYSMWSHRRSMRWKGFLKIDLAPQDDVQAADLLAARALEFAHEPK